MYVYVYELSLFLSVYNTKEERWRRGGVCVRVEYGYIRVCVCIYIMGNGMIWKEGEGAESLSLSLSLSLSSKEKPSPHAHRWLRIETEIAVPRAMPTRIEPSASHPDSEPILPSLGKAISLLLLLLAPLPLP